MCQNRKETKNKRDYQILSFDLTQGFILSACDSSPSNGQMAQKIYNHDTEYYLQHHWDNITQEIPHIN